MHNELQQHDDCKRIMTKCFIMNKADLRKIIKDKKRQYSSSQLEELSLSVLSQLAGNHFFHKAHTLLMYYSLPDEVNTHSFIDQMVTDGKRVLLPVVIDSENMEIREYSGKQDLKEGAFHIMEPIGKLFPRNRYSEIDVAVIPGMGFDDDGNRLGRGKGYYDRFLQQVPRLYKIGVCFPFQKLENIPTEETDIKMNEVIPLSHKNQDE